MATRIIRTLTATLSDGREVRQGDVVENITDEDVAWLESGGGLVPEGYESWADFEAHASDVYRGGHGDTEAAERLAARVASGRSGGIVDIDSSTAKLTDGQGDVEQYAAWLRDEKPTEDQVIEMAHEDPERASRILEAENLVTGQKPRKGVEKRLTSIIESGS